jgi:hypothetical protein
MSTISPAPTDPTKPTISLAPTLNWLRLQRDWYAEPGLGLACDDVGPAAAAGWPLLLVRALLNGGWFSDRNDVASSLRCLDIGLNMQIATAVADAFIRHGLVLPEAGGYVIADIDRYIPADNAIPPQARRAARVLRRLSPGDALGALPESSSEVTDGAMDAVTNEPIERVTDLADAQQLTPDPAGTHLKSTGTTSTITSDDPPRDPMRCSHGYSWKWHPGQQSASGDYQSGYLGGNHSLSDGSMCMERAILE